MVTMVINSALGEQHGPKWYFLLVTSEVASSGDLDMQKTWMPFFVIPSSFLIQAKLRKKRVPRPSKQPCKPRLALPGWMAQFRLCVGGSNTPPDSSTKIGLRASCTSCSKCFWRQRCIEFPRRVSPENLTFSGAPYGHHVNFAPKARQNRPGECTNPHGNCQFQRAPLTLHP